MSGEHKVVALYEAAKAHTYKYPEQTLDEVLTDKTEAKREACGAVWTPRQPTPLWEPVPKQGRQAA